MNASKQRYGKADLKDLFQDASRIIVAKGKKVTTLDVGKEPTNATQLAAVVLGPTGNLRAPTLKVGKTWLVGFNEEAYSQRFA